MNYKRIAISLNFVTIGAVAWLTVNSLVTFAPTNSHVGVQNYFIDLIFMTGPVILISQALQISIVALKLDCVGKKNPAKH